MATDPTPPAPPAPAPAPGMPLEPRHLAYGLFVLTGLCAAIPIGLLIQAKGNFQAALTPVFIWGCVLALEALVGAVVTISYTAEGKTMEKDQVRLLLLVLGGAAGLATAILGAVLPFVTFADKLKGGLESWRANPMAVVWPALALLGGLGLMFASLQLGRGMERTNQTMRRLIYGYNAVLTGLLLLAILALPNVLSYASPFSRFMGKTDDWTKARVYTLQDSTRAYLSELQVPVRIILLLGANDPRTGEMRILLDNFRSVTNKVTWTLIPIDVSEGIDLDLIRVQQRYKLSDPYGAVVVVGDEKDEKFDFIPANDLASGAGEGNYFFTGEKAILNSIKFLTEGKATVYFTQGSGEAELTGGMPRMPGMPPPRGPSIAELSRRLSQRKGIDVKPLSPGPTFKGVPADATAVVVPGPTKEMPKEMVKALEDYLNRKGDKAGRMIVMLDPVPQKEGDRIVFVKSGLEGFLAKQGVKLGNDIICNSRYDDRRLFRVEAITPAGSSNPIARAFNNPDSPFALTLFPFSLPSRTVSPMPNAPPGGTTVEKLLVTRQNGYWAEEDPDVDLGAKARSVRAMRETNPEKWQQLAGEPLSMAVTVTAGAGAGIPGDAAHARLQKPRMVVIGNSSWALDQLQGAPGTARNLDLFENCLSWLREKPTVGKTAPEEGVRKRYDLGISREHQTRMTWLPLALMALAVVGLGCGVWVVRRR